MPFRTARRLRLLVMVEACRRACAGSTNYDPQRPERPDAKREGSRSGIADRSGVRPESGEVLARAWVRVRAWRQLQWLGVVRHGQSHRQRHRPGRRDRRAGGDRHPGARRRRAALGHRPRAGRGGRALARRAGPGRPAGDRRGVAVPAGPADRRDRAGRHRHRDGRRRAAARPRTRRARPAHRPRGAARLPDEAARRSRLGKFYYRPPGGESWADVLLRLRALLRELREDHPDGRVLLFAPRGDRAAGPLPGRAAERGRPDGLVARRPPSPTARSAAGGGWTASSSRSCSTTSTICTARAPRRPGRRTSMPSRSEPEPERSSPRTCCGSGHCRTRRATRSRAAPCWWSAARAPTRARCCSPGSPRCGPAPVACNWPSSRPPRPR